MDTLTRMSASAHNPTSAQRRTGRASLALLSLVTLLAATLASWSGLAGSTTVAQAHGASALTSTVTSDDWPAYQHDAQRSATSADTTLTTGAISQLRPLWTYQTGNVIVAEPAIVSGVAYVGSWDGYEYAINTTTGQLIWKTSLGITSVAACSPSTAGVSSSATVQNGMVYVGGGDSYWYALNASDGSVAWRVFVGDNSATGGHYNWSSPAIYNGYAYVGIASFGDCPLVQGQVLQISLTTHQIVNTFNLVPTGQAGAGVWGSPTVDPTTGTVYVATGNSGYGAGYYGQALVALDANTLALKGYWQVPQNLIGSDSDFGNTPVLFTDSNARQLVGAVNKDGVVYAFDRTNVSAGPVWQTTVAYGGQCPECGDGSISSMTFTNNQLYVAGGNTNINGVGYAGSVSALNPTTGAFIWRRGELNFIMTPLTSDNGMIIAEPGPIVEALDANSGARLFSYKVSPMYSGVSIANGQLVFGSTNGMVYALALPTTTPPPPPPDANCPAGWICQDLGAPSTTGAETTSGATWTISADGIGATGTSDQLRFISQNTTGSAQIVADVQAPSATSASAQAGVMFRQATDAGSPFYAAYLTPTGAVTIAYRLAFGGIITSYTSTVSASGATPLYLQIQRSGDYYATSTSTDGVNYTLVPGTTTPMTMSDLLMSGVFAASGVNGTLGSANISAAATGAISDTPVAMPSAHACPTGWSCQDIGNGVPVGDQTLTSGTWSITGGGLDLGNLYDQFHYVWQPLAADGTLSAHVASQTNTSSYAKAGLMMRLSTDPAAPYYAVVVTPGQGLMVYERKDIGMRYSPLATLASVTAPTYLRISRAGTTFSAYYSTDNATWILIPGSTDTLPAFSGAALEGMMVNSSSVSGASVATFDTITTSSCSGGWQCADIGAPTLVGSQSASAGVWNIQAAGSDIWNTADQFHYVWQAFPADGTLSAHVASQANTSAWAKAGVMLRLSSDPAAPFYDVVVTPSNGVVAQWRTTAGANAQGTASVTGLVAPTWVKITRSGTTYSGYTSPDGVTWTLIPGSTIAIAALTGAVSAGLAVTAHANTLGSATFDTVALSTCPDGWQCADIGSPTLNGGQTVSAGAWSIQGAGSDIWLGSDQFRYAWQTLASDGVLSAHVASQANTSAWAKAGVMLRLSSDPTAPFYDVVVTPSNGVAAQWRTTAGASAQGSASVTGLVAPTWVKITRSGTTYSGYTSPDGVTWTLIPGSTVTIAALTGTLDAGLAVTSHAATLGLATFDTVTIGAPSASTCPTGWQCADIGAPALAGTQALNAGVWSLQGQGSDIWNTADQFHYVWQTLAADGTLSAHVASQTNTSAWAKAGVMLRLSSDPAAPFYDVVVTPVNGVVAQWRATAGGSAQGAASVSGLVAPTWVEVVRSGTTYSGYTSPDGVTWTLIPGSTVTIAALTGTLDAGLAVTSHAATSGAATFDTVTLTNSAPPPPPPPACPTGWQCADIGAPALAGTQALNAGVWTLQGQGSDIWNTADQFHYVWQTLAADGSLSAHVASQTNTSAWAKAGVMLRLSSDPTAPFYDVVVTPSNGVVAQWRMTAGATAHSTASVTGLVAPTWVKITRVGTTYSGYTSPDGVTWTLIPGSTVTVAALTGTLDAGLAVTSHAATSGAATFDTVTLG